MLSPIKRWHSSRRNIKDVGKPRSLSSQPFPRRAGTGEPRHSRGGAERCSNSACEPGSVPFTSQSRPRRSSPPSARAAGRRRARPAPERRIFIGMAARNRPFRAWTAAEGLCLPASSRGACLRVCVDGCGGSRAGEGRLGRCLGGENARAWAVPVPIRGLGAGPPCLGLGRGSGSSGHRV